MKEEREEWLKEKAMFEEKMKEMTVGGVEPRFSKEDLSEMLESLMDKKMGEFTRKTTKKVNNCLFLINIVSFGQVSEVFFLTISAEERDGKAKGGEGEGGGAG